MLNTMEYREYIRARERLVDLKSHIRRQIKANLAIRPAFDLERWQAVRKVGKVLAKAIQPFLLRKNTSDEVLGLDTLSFDELQRAVGNHNYYVTLSVAGKVFQMVRCPLTDKAVVWYLSRVIPRDSPKQLHASVRDTAVWHGGFWYPSEDAVKAMCPVNWLELRDGAVVQNFGQTLPEHSTIQVSAGEVYVPKAISAYHSGEKRKCLESSEDASAVYAGIELEFNRGSVSNLEAAARTVRQVSDLSLIVEHDSSITGFEVVTGYGLPATLREQTLRRVFSQRAFAGMKTSTRTGMHVHVTKKPAMEGNLLTLWPAIKDIYRRLAAREYNTYCSRYPMQYRTSALSKTPISTFEWRLFKNPGNLPRVMANMQFAWATTLFAKDNNDPLRFSEFLMSLPPEHTVELRAHVVANTAQTSVAVGKDELAKYYPRGQGIIGVARALA